MKERSSSIIKCILCIIKCMLSNVYYCCFCEIFNQFGANLVTDVKCETGLELVMEEEPLHCAEHSIIAPPNSLHCTYSIEYSTMCIVQCIMENNGEQSIIAPPNSLHCTVYSIYTVYSVQCTMENNGEHSIIAP